MATFFTNLFESIFTPGPTPSLVLATNVSFAALQVLLFTLVISTWNIHFAILSVLCGGLWASVNWFVRELAASQASVPPQTQAGDDKRQQRKDARSREGEDSGTETEDGRPTAEGTGITSEEQRRRENTRLRVVSEDKNKRLSGGDISASGTDSEWDKVDDDELR